MNKSRLPAFMNASNLGSMKIAGLYLLLGALWILFSDMVVERIAPDPSALTTISIYKGWGFIIVTALLLYWLIQRHTAELREDDKRSAPNYGCHPGAHLLYGFEPDLPF